MGAYRQSTIVRIDCDPPALLWSGAGLLPVEADAVIPSATIALGGDGLVSVPDFQQLVGGTAERLDLVVSGVDAETVRLAVDEAAGVKGARVDVGTVHFDDAWQIDHIEWENRFEARSLSISRPRDDGSGKVVRSITLTIVHGSSARARATLSTFTDADQRRRSPTDAVFSHVAGITAGTSRRFGPSDA